MVNAEVFWEKLTTVLRLVSVIRKGLNGPL